MSELESIKMPALCVAASGFLYSVEDRMALETCGRGALRTGFFSAMQIVDSYGESFLVHGAHEVGTVGPFGGFRLLKSPRIRIALQLDYSGRLEIEGVKALVVKAIERLPGPWEAVEDLSDTRARIARQTSIRQLIDLFRNQVAS